MTGSWLQRQAQLHPERPAFYWHEKAGRLLAKEVYAYAAYYQAQFVDQPNRVALLAITPLKWSLRSLRYGSWGSKSSC